MDGIYKEIEVGVIFANPLQPRKEFDSTDLQELAESIKQQGLLQPILVEDFGDGRYVLVAGERRWRAVTQLGWQTIGAIVQPRSNHNGRELLVKALTENMVRANMNPMETAESLVRMHEEFDMDYNEIAKLLGISRTGLDTKTILVRLDPEIKEMIRSRELTHLAEVARALLRIPDKSARIKMAQRIVSTRMTIKSAIRASEKLAEQLGNDKTIRRTTAMPSIQMLRERQRDVDIDRAPLRWDALRQVGSIPPWELVIKTASATCASCALAATASRSTCGACPLVDYLDKLVSHAR